MDSRVCDFLQKHNIVNADQHFVGMNYDDLMQLQPHHLPILIPKLDDRIILQSSLFKAIMEKKSSMNANGQGHENNEKSSLVTFDESYSLELDEESETMLSNNESEITASNVVFKIVSSGVETVKAINVDQDAEKKIRDQANEARIEHQGDKFCLHEIEDMDFIIVTKKYARWKALESADRIELARCVIKHCLKLDVKKQLDRYDFDNLAGTIVRMFPTELKESYYIPGHDRVPPRGKLYNVYKGYRERLSAAAMINLRTKKKATKRNRSDDSLEDEELEGGTVVLQQKLDAVGQIEFLSTHTEPWATICDYWKATSAERQVLMKESNMETYIKTFPAIQMANGFELIDIDFRSKYPQAKISIDWKKYVSAALRYAVKVKDKTAKELIAGSQVKTNSDEMVLALKLLPFILPVQRGKKIASKKTLSKLEVSQKFISHFKTENDDDRSKVDFISFKIIGVETHISYVRLGNEVEHAFTNIFDAITFCFKSFYVYNLEFPAGTEQVWDFINLAFFNIETAGISPTCFTLLSDLKALDA